MLLGMPPACLPESVRPHHFSPPPLIQVIKKVLPYLTCLPRRPLLGPLFHVPSWFPPRTC
jgi:hypothetical protein